MAAAQYGRPNIKRQSYGHALAVNPWGTIIHDAGGYGDNINDDDDDIKLQMTIPSIITCTIDKENTIQSIRRRMPILQHRQNAGKLSF